MEYSSELKIDLMKKISDETISIEEYLKAAEIYASENDSVIDKSQEAKVSFKKLVLNGIIGNQKGAKEPDLSKVKWVEFATPEVVNPQKVLKTVTKTDKKGNVVSRPAYFNNLNFMNTILENVENNVSSFYDRNKINTEKALRDLDPSFENLKQYPFGITSPGQIVNVHRTRVSGDAGIARAYGADDGTNALAYQPRKANPINKLPPQPDFDKIFKDALNDIDPQKINPNAQLAKKALLFSRNSIMRIGEIADLFIEDIDFTTGYVPEQIRHNKIRAAQTLNPLTLNLVRSIVFNPDGSLKDKRYDTKNPDNKLTVSGKGGGGWSYTGTPIFNPDKIKQPVSRLTAFLLGDPKKGGGGLAEKLKKYETLMGRPFEGASDMRKIVATYAAARFPINERGEVSIAMGRKPSAIGSMTAVDEESYIGKVVGQGDDATQRVLLSIGNDFARALGYTHINQIAGGFNVDIPELWDSETNLINEANALAVPEESNPDFTNQKRPMTRGEKRLASQKTKEEIARSQLAQQKFIQESLKIEKENLKTEQKLWAARKIAAKRPVDERYGLQLKEEINEIEVKEKALNNLQTLNLIKSEDLTKKQRVEKQALENMLGIKKKPLFSWMSDFDTDVASRSIEDITSSAKSRMDSVLSRMQKFKPTTQQVVGAITTGVTAAVAAPLKAADILLDVATTPTALGPVIQDDPSSLGQEELLQMMESDSITPDMKQFSELAATEARTRAEGARAQAERKGVRGMAKAGQRKAQQRLKTYESALQDYAAEDAEGFEGFALKRSNISDEDEEGEGLRITIRPGPDTGSALR
tara:strand:- start:286 stop:2724 length:2439 start_codon:yes stop_codon:yes gene_type:complete